MSPTTGPGAGRAVLISSLLGFVALPYRGAYTASKHALEGLTDTLRLELAGTGIRVSLVESGPIRSRFRENGYAAYLRHIRPQASLHRATYSALEHRLLEPAPVAPFTRGPEAVLRVVAHALEGTRPRTRYRVTVPAGLFAILHRLLPDRALDRVLLAVSRRESRA